MLMKIFLSMNEQKLQDTEHHKDSNLPLDLSKRPHPFMMQSLQDNPLDLSTPPVFFCQQQNILTFSQKSTAKGNEIKPRTQKQSIKRPMNAFMIWAQTERRNLQSLHPELDNCSISKILGRRWREMEGAEKQFYYDQQAALATLHMQKYPGYKYTPR